MCYTNTLHAKPKKVAKAYNLADSACPEFESKAVATGFDFPEWPILTSAHSGEFILAKWGLIPSWVNDMPKALEIRTSTLNARSETLQDKPAFKGAAGAGQRCLIPSTGFFEWQTVGKKKYPYFISVKNQEVFSFAGLWEVRDAEPDGQPLITFTIITVPANPLMAKIHNSKMRMPAILIGENVAKWLDPQTSQAELGTILSPISEDLMEAHTVKPLKNTGAGADFESATALYEYPELTRQLSLFSD